MSNVIGVREAVGLVRYGSTLLIGGSGAGHAVPQAGAPWRLVDAAMDLALDAGRAAELDASERIFASEDMLKGANAFFGKRDPEFRGR